MSSPNTAVSTRVMILRQLLRLLRLLSKACKSVLVQRMRRHRLRKASLEENFYLLSPNLVAQKTARCSTKAVKTDETFY